RTKIFASFELVAQSAPDDGPVGGAILIRRKSPARWLVRDAVLPNFKLLDQDQSSNSHRACAAHGFAAKHYDRMGEARVSMTVRGGCRTECRAGRLAQLSPARHGFAGCGR